MGTDFTLENVSSGSSTFTIPEGAAEVTLTYVPGSFEEGHSYVILDPNGAVAAEDKPSPVVGEVGLRVCQAEE